MFLIYIFLSNSLRYNGGMIPSSGPNKPLDPDSPSLTSASLLERVRARDPQAWAKFVAVYGPLVYAWCRQWGMQQSDAHDITQEVFQAVSGGIDGFHKDGAAGTFRGWLWTIARNKANTFYLQQSRRPQAIGGTDLQARLAEIPDRYPDEATNPQASAETTSLIHRAMNLIRGDFQERTWRAFLRTAVDGVEATKVAEEFAMTPRGVRQAKHRVLQRLREEFRDLME
jgi:RNA polymerase sigma-70 factor, ECF subfamily